MLRKNLILLASLFLLLFFISCNNSEKKNDISSIKERGELIVAMDEEMPGYFVFGGENYGYQYDLFKAYADYLGVDLRIVNGITLPQGKELMSKGDVDIITTLSGHISSDEQSNVISIYNTSYVMLARKEIAEKVRKSSDFQLVPFLKHEKLLVSSGFKTSKAYDELLDSLPHANIYVSSRNSFELIELLVNGEYDCLICEMSEAQLGSALVSGVEQIYTFSEQIPLSAVFHVDNGELRSDFDSWLNTFRNGPDYAMLNYLYFEKGIVYQVVGNNKKNVIGGISVYDKMIKQISAREGYDWRFISAIIYSESRFNPNVVSKRGARGLMQIMPRVANQFKIADQDIMKPENNVLLGIKILGKIESSLKFPKDTPNEEKMKIVLACYNAGLGHVIDARNLARKYGADPNKWDDVSKYLSLKGDALYATDDVVKCGKFKSGQTLSFVAEVYAKYTSYCNTFTL